MNIAWPLEKTEKDNLSLKIELERFYGDIKNSQLTTDEKLDEIKTSLKDFHNKTILKRPKISNKQKLQIKHLKALSKDRKVYISKFDKGNGVCI